MATKIEAIVRAIRGEAEQVGRAISSKNLRLICKYRVNVDKQLENLLLTFSSETFTEAERERLNALCSDAEKLARDTIFSADEYEALIQDKENAASVARVADAELGGFKHKVETMAQMLKKAPQDSISKVDLDGKRGVIIECIKQVEVMYADLGLAFVRLIQSVADSDTGAIEKVKGDYQKLQGLYVTWMEQANQVKGSLTETTSSGGDNQKVCDVKIQPLQLPVFRGEPREYARFRREFSDTVEKRFTDPQVRCLYLQNQCLKGQARELVRGLNTYDTVIERLDQRYGRSSMIVNEILRELESLKISGEGEQKGVIKICNFLQSAWDDLKAVNALNEFCNVVTLQMLEGKLSTGTQMKWATEKSKLDDSPSSAQLMEKLKAFLDKEQRIAENVMLMQGKMEGVTKDEERGPKDKFKKSTGSFNGMIDDKSKGRSTNSCYRCGGPGHFARDCKVPRSIKCRRCGETGHIERACQGRKVSKDDPPKNEIEKDVRFKEGDKENKVGITVANSGSESVNVRLPVEVVDTEFGSCNVLWDSGSTLNLVSRCWVRKHNISGRKCKLSFKVVDGTNRKIESILYSFNLRAKDGSNRSIRAYELESIATPVSSIDVNGVVSVLNSAGVVVNVDEISNPCGELDLLLGTECMPVFPRAEAVVRRLCLMVSDFGVSKYFVAGSHEALGGSVASKLVHSVCFSREVCVTPIDDVCSGMVKHLDGKFKSSLMNDFWSIEQLGVQLPPVCSNCKKCKFCNVESQSLSFKEARELDVIKYNLSYVADSGYWRTSYPFERPPECLKDNYAQALMALERRERRLMTDGRIASLYNDQVRDFVNRGVLRKLSEAEMCEWTGPVRYVDHHHVMKVGSTTPVRLVINSSFAKKGELSLNSILLKGPNILNCMFEILARWRTWPEAFVGDIKKMYHNVATGELEGHVRRLLWREYRTDKAPDVYVFRTVTFGDRPAGCIVMTALRRTAEMFESIDAAAANVIIRDSYMDDVVSGAQSREQATAMINHIQEITSKGGFQFKKFTTSWMETDDDHEESVLGIRWNVGEDKVSANMKVSDTPNKGKWTRRACWRFTSSFYDPLGFWTPVTVRLKILMKVMFVGSQKYKTWDAELDDIDQKMWSELASIVAKLQHVWLRRICIPGRSLSGSNCCMVGFCDASMEAMCAVVYCRYDGGNGDTDAFFFAAKSRVTPAKQETMPRLELCGALLLSRLMVKCRSCLTFAPFQEYFLCDSKIVLGQLANTNRLINDFVGVRVLEIRSNTGAGMWAYVPSEDNVADMGTRGVDPEILANRWFPGPSWLKDSVDLWPVEFFQFDENKDNVFQVTEDKPIIDAAKFSSLARLNRVTAVCLIFAGSRGNGKPVLRRRDERVDITVEHLQKAELFWLKTVNKEVVRLYQSGKLSSLRPSLVWNHQGKFAQVVTSGRLGSLLKVGYDIEELPILDPKHPYVKLILRDFHEKEHASDDKVMWQVRTKFWIPQARRLIRSIRKGCYKCRLLCRKVAGQIMSPLPSERVMPTPPWTNVAVDLFGPFECKDPVKKRTKVKVWGIIFTCLVTRASHLDVTCTYGSDSLLQALRRFVSLRGCPRQIISDQGSQMVGCSKEVEFLLELISWDHVKGWCTTKGIDWKLIPPQGQHMNGCAESLIRHTKRILCQRLEGIVLTFEELQTVLYEVANILNSRPLGIYSKPGDDPLDGGPITPNHLLLGRASSEIPQFKYENVTLTRRVKFLQDIVSQFWHKWFIVAFPSLVPNYKWRVQQRNLCVGDVVLMKDESASPGEYKLGQVSGVKLSGDGCVRSVTVRYVKSLDGVRVHGYVCRPVHKLIVILPVEEQ